MWNNKKVIISMTSYPKRIMNVGICIFYALQQSIKPDEIHLWLAETEFPNKEKSLPDDLQCIIEEHPQVFLHWLSNNTYCFKRYEIFRNKNNFYCFFFDDDVHYKNNLIESTLKLSDTYKDCIINYTNYGLVYYDGKHQLYKTPAYNYPTPNNRFCGQCMIPSWIYPQEMFTKENLDFRDKYCCICDETWLTQFIVKNKINVFNNNLPWGNELNSYNCNKIGIVSQVNTLDKDGLNFRDRCLMKIFEVFPDNKKYYEEHFNYGK